MRLLQLGDTHLGIRGGLVGAPRGTDRASDHLAAFEAALRPVWEGRVDAVVHTGDCFDRSRPPRRAVLAAAERLVAVARRVPVLVVSGNHDRRGLLRYIPQRLPGLHVVDRPSVVRLGELAIAAMPFVRRPDVWAAQARELCAGGVDCLVAHQAFEGSRVPGFTFQVGRPADTLGVEHLPDGLRWILSGHLHPHQVVELGASTVVHGGSTERTAFSEASQAKGSVHWEWGREVRWRFVEHRVRRAVRIKGPEDLRRVQPGDWVQLSRHRTDELAREVRRRGGWLQPARSGSRRTPSREPTLFDQRARSSSTASAAS